MHKQIEVKLGSSSIPIDEMLAPLIEEMWKSFIMTNSSCQEWEPECGLAWISFPNEYELKKFLNLVGNSQDKDDMQSLYRRMNPPFSYHEDVPKWEFGVYVSDNNIIYADGNCDFSLNFHIWFPQSDIPLLIDALRRNNKMPLECV